MPAIGWTSSVGWLGLGAPSERALAVADELEGCPEERLPGLVEQGQLRLAQRRAGAAAAVEPAVEPPHQPGGRPVLDPPEALHQGGRPSIQETARQADQLVATVDGRAPALAGAQDDQRAGERQLE